MKVIRHPRSRLDVVSFLRARASERPNDGTFESTRLLDSLKVLYVPNRGPATQLIFSRDVGTHTSGWWKNPDYERCYHLSLSFFDLDVITRWLDRAVTSTETGALPKDAEETRAWLELFFGAYARLLWCEPPTSRPGRSLGVWHYRLFCDEHWHPLLPRGEVYTRQFTAAGWKSWSDVQAEEQQAAMADLEARS